MRFSGYQNVPGAPGQAAYPGMNPMMMAGNPSFDINRGAGSLGGRSGEQLKRLYEGGTQQNQQLNEELRRRGIMPGGPQLPLAFGMGGVPPMGNAGAMNMPMTQMPMGFQNKTVS